MARCFVPECGTITRNAEAYCRDCYRLIPQDHRDHLRMTYRSPFYGAKALERPEGGNVMWTWEGEGMERGGVATKSPEDAATALAWVEMRLALEAVGRVVWKARKRKAARARIMGR